MEFLALLLGVAALAIASKASNRAKYVDDQLDALRLAAHEDRLRLQALESRQPRAATVEAASDADVPATLAAAPAPQEAHPPQPEPTPVREPEPLILRVGWPAERFAPEPAPEPASEVEVETGRGINFEELFGRRLPVWGGSVALALAGFFLVKYSIDSGLLTPAVRSVLGLVFGVVLIVAAEASRRIERFAIDPRIAQALSGAGVAVLYGAFYMATNLYGLVSPTVGFVGMAVTTAAALGLSLRYGAPTALVGLLGGFATPALVNTGEGNVPALLAYLMLTIAGLLGVARQQGWRWLGALALAGGFGWSGILLLTDISGFDVPGTGLFLILLAFGGLLVMRGEPREGDDDIFAIGIPLVSAVMAFVQLALLVGKGGFGWLEWGLYALLSVGVTVLAVRDAAYRGLPLAALAIALVTFALWPDPSLQALAIVGGGLLAVFALPGLVFAVRRQDWLLWLIAAVVTPMLTFAVAYVRRIEAMPETSWGLVALGLALPSLVAAYASHRRGADDDLRFPALVGGGAVLAITGAALIVPPLQLPFAIFVVAAALAAVGHRTRRIGLSHLTAAASLAAAVSYLDDAPGAFDAAGRALGIVASTDMIGGIWRFVLPAVVVAGIAALQGRRARLVYASGIAGLLALAAVQFVSLDWRAAALALLAAVLLEAARRQGMLPLRLPAIGVAAFAGLWSAVPMLLIAGESLVTLGGGHMNVSDLPSVAKVATWLLLPAAMAGFAAWRERGSRLASMLAGPAAIFAAGALFVFYKQVFAIEGDVAFARYGFAERILLTQALFALGFAAYRQGGLQVIARVLTLAALARLVWFDLVVFNPLLQAQAVGGWPLVNLLLPAYALVPVWLWFAARAEAPLAERIEMSAKLVGLAASAAWLALSVRQIFAGSVLTEGGLTSAENYSYSVAGLGFAIGLLVLGTVRRDQLMRLVSLGVMLLTVGKVFLLDAAELGGLWRIASFLGLGVCLIGISWYYTRRVFADPLASA